MTFAGMSVKSHNICDSASDVGLSLAKDNGSVVIDCCFSHSHSSYGYVFLKVDYFLTLNVGYLLNKNLLESGEYYIAHNGLSVEPKNVFSK
jgi:hypothetical protein